MIDIFKLYSSKNFFELIAEDKIPAAKNRFKEYYIVAGYACDPDPNAKFLSGTYEFKMRSRRNEKVIQDFAKRLKSNSTVIYMAKDYSWHKAASHDAIRVIKNGRLIASLRDSAAKNYAIEAACCDCNHLDRYYALKNGRECHSEASLHYENQEEFDCNYENNDECECDSACNYESEDDLDYDSTSNYESANECECDSVCSHESKDDCGCNYNDYFTDGDADYLDLLEENITLCFYCDLPCIISEALCSTIIAFGRSNDISDYDYFNLKAAARKYKKTVILNFPGSEISSEEFTYFARRYIFKADGSIEYADEISDHINKKECLVAAYFSNNSSAEFFNQKYNTNELNEAADLLNYTTSEPYILKQFNLAEKNILQAESAYKNQIEQAIFKELAEKPKRDYYITLIRSAAYALVTRLTKINCRKVFLGISGGIDSTLALLIAKTAELFYDYKLVAVAMPCFGSTEESLKIAEDLCKSLNFELRIKDISAAAEEGLKLLGRDQIVYDHAYENVQARLRTATLMNLANAEGGIVLGTGDLSEIALGWCTYNGDSISMYNPNSGITKTLAKKLIKAYADNSEPAKTLMRKALYQVIERKISPELMPLNDQGKSTQSTEDIIGPYRLHDFYLYCFLRPQFKIESLNMFLAAKSYFKNTYSDEILLKTLKTFIKRFFTAQFKRDASPAGAYLLDGSSLSPRTGLRNASDYNNKAMLETIDKICRQLNIDLKK